MVALDFACLRGTAVSHVVLINSSSRLSPPSAKLRPFGMLQLARALTETDVRKREEMIYSITLNGAENAVRRYAALGADIAESAPVSRLTAIRQLIAAGRYQPKRPLANCLALAGSRDRLVDPGCSAALAAYLQCPLLVHPTGGHDLPVEDPRWVAARVQRWVWSAVEPQSKFAQTRVNG
jgi:pimeloyl-ACP methyl ester carboxylesterase